MLNVALILAIALACAAIWLLRSQRGAIAFVAEPRFGILDLKAGAADSIVAEDTEALTAVFGTPAQSTGAAPRCDVLFVCCDIDADGQVRNSRGTLRDFVRDSWATVVVVASENEASAYVAASKDKRYGLANLVMTMQRRGRVFPSFFVRLFSEMKAGISMPVAWAKLAPQIPGLEHADCPATIFACERG